MKYFKNTELAKIYHVSEKSVRNWIDAAESGKLSLQLVEEDSKKFIASTSKNTTIVEELVAKGKKYKNTRGHKVVTPTANFYKLYDTTAIFDIISSLDIYREIPVQYSYFDGGAVIWDNYVRRLAEEDTQNILTNTIELIDLNMAYIEKLLAPGARINLIDIGPGNCYPVRKMLERLVERGRLNRYICIDISPDMLRIAENNVREWFGDEVQFEGHIRDIAYQRFDNLLALDSFGKDETIQNVVLFLGGTLSNFREESQPLHTVRDSMGKDDLLIFTRQLDTPKARRYFDFGSGHGHPSEQQRGPTLTPKSKFALDLLNIDPSLYDVEFSFDEEKMIRSIRVNLRVALSIEFELEGKPKMISFNKGESILLWYHNHRGTMQTLNQFDKNGFALVEAMTSADGECLLSISKIKTDVSKLFAKN